MCKARNYLLVTKGQQQLHSAENRQTRRNRVTHVPVANTGPQQRGLLTDERGTALLCDTPASSA